MPRVFNLSEGNAPCSEDPHAPVHARGSVAVPGKLLDAREFAEQVFDIAADVVLSKLAVIGLTVENIKKLENLGRVPPLVEGGSQAANIADAVMRKLVGVGLTQENIKKLVNLGEPLAASGGSQATRTSLYMDRDGDNLEGFPPFHSEGRLLLAEADHLRPPSTKESNPFDALSTQFSGKRTRVTPPADDTRGAATIAPLKKRSRHNEISRKNGELVNENRKDHADHFCMFHASPMASGLPIYGAENTLVENVQYRDQHEDDLLRGNIRDAIQKLLQNPTAREKSEAQMEAVLLIMRKRQDALITMRTGGGKSMLWLIPPLLDPKARFIVVCPFTALLDQQYEIAQRHRLQAIKYGVEDIGSDAQILFVQVEHVGNRKFSKCVSRFLAGENADLILQRADEGGYPDIYSYVH